MRIIRRYLLRETTGLFVLSLFIITVLFMSQRIIQLTEYAVNQGVGPSYIARLLVYHLPAVMIIVIPIVTLFSILLTVGRLSADNEITALKSSGVSLYRLFPPVLLFSLFTFSLALLISQSLIPGAARATQRLTYKIVKTRTEAAVKDRTFIDLLRDFTIYVREKKPDGTLSGILAAEERGRQDGSWRIRRTIVARSGRFANDPVLLTNELWLSDGILISEDKKSGRDDFVTFTTLRIMLDLNAKRVSDDDRRKMLDFFELNEEIAGLRSRKLDKDGLEELVRMEIAWHERLAFPVGCLVLAFWGVPLGIQPPRAGRARAIVVSVLLSAFFYYLMILSKFLALDGALAPGVLIWVPDLVILVTGVYMLRQKNLERPIFLFSRVEDWLYYAGEKIREYRERKRKEKR